MALDEFRQTYVRLCRDNHVELQNDIMDAVIRYIYFVGRPTYYCFVTFYIYINPHSSSDALI